MPASDLEEGLSVRRIDEERSGSSVCRMATAGISLKSVHDAEQTHRGVS